MSDSGNCLSLSAHSMARLGWPEGAIKRSAERAKEMLFSYSDLGSGFNAQPRANSALADSWRPAARFSRTFKPIFRISCRVSALTEFMMTLLDGIGVVIDRPRGVECQSGSIKPERSRGLTLICASMARRSEPGCLRSAYPRITNVGANSSPSTAVCPIKTGLLK